MADITSFLRLVAGIARQVDISSNTLVTLSVKVGGSITNTELTKTILDNLVNLQNGSDFSTGTSSHTHDGRYFTKTQLQSNSGGTAGSTLIGDDASYLNFTPTATTVKGALSGIDTKLGTLAGTNSFSDALFNIFNSATPSKKINFSAAAISAATVRTITMPDADVDLSKVLSAIQKDGSVTFTANQPMGSFKLTGLAAGSGAGDSVRYEQAILASGVNAFAANQSLGNFKITSLAYGTSTSDAIRQDQAVSRSDGTSDFTAASKKITNLADPTSAQDAATKAYVDAVQQGLKPKAACKVGTTADITLSGEQTIDGVLTSASRVLVKNQSTTSQNGIYVSAAGAWARATDFDSLSPIDEINGAYTFLQSGTTQAGQGWVENAVVATLGTDPITFVYFNDVSTIIGGDMISVTGSTIAVDLASTSGLESTNPGNSAGQLRAKLEASNPSLQINGSNELGVKFNAAGAIVSSASGILVQLESSNPTLQISSNLLGVKLDAARAVTTGASGIGVNVDNSTVEINANAVRVKDAGITAAKLAAGTFDQTTITGGTGSAAAVQYAPKIKATRNAGEGFAANTSFAVRFAINGETAGRAYKADKDASGASKYNVVGMVEGSGASAVTTGNPVSFVTEGSITLGSSDTNFGATDIGKEVFLTATGGFSVTAPTATNDADFVIGYVEDINKIYVTGKHLRGVN